MYIHLHTHNLYDTMYITYMPIHPSTLISQQFLCLTFLHMPIPNSIKNVTIYTLEPRVLTLLLLRLRRGKEHVMFLEL